MRFERHGGPPDLQSAFTTFITSHLHGRALDDNQVKEAAEGEFPDFACFRDLVLIEMKHLETDQHDRINEVLDAKIDPAEKPIFYGSREAHFVTNSVSNGAAINAAIGSKLGRTIETLLSKANRQFESYRSLGLDIVNDILGREVVLRTQPNRLTLRDVLRDLATLQRN